MSGRGPAPGGRRAARIAEIRRGESPPARGREVIPMTEIDFDALELLPAEEEQAYTAPGMCTYTCQITCQITSFAE
jgi:hypothetical protein